VTQASTGDEAVTERQRLVATLHNVDATAPTLAGDWRARDVAQHLAAQDRLGGIPALMARAFVHRTGLRLTETYLRSDKLARLVNGRPRSWGWAIRVLERPPPAPVLRPSIAPITLWEYFVHHEDVRRPNNRPRSTSPDLSAVIPWVLRYNAERLRGTLVRVVTVGGNEWRVGQGREVILIGTPDELVLWLSGRHRTAQIDVRGDLEVARILRTRLAI